MKKATFYLSFLTFMVFLLVSCSSSDSSSDDNSGNGNGGGMDDGDGSGEEDGDIGGSGEVSKDTLTVEFNEIVKDFRFHTDGNLTDNQSLLTISGFLEDDSLSPSLFLKIEKSDGKIIPGTYYLDENPNLAVSAQYTIERAEDGATITNTIYETRDIGEKTDMKITITALDNDRVKGTFSGVIVTTENVTVDTLYVLTNGKFDVFLKSE